MYTSIQFKMDCFHHFAALLQHDVPVKDNQLCYTAFSTFGLWNVEMELILKWWEKQSAHMQVQNYLLYKGCP